jgi:hypothetical protein
MLKAAFIVCLFILLDGSECDPQKQNARISSLESEVKQLKAEVAELKEKPKQPEHHYELRKEGFRTWRFDPSTGETCVQLTTEADWKNKKTQSESCDCSDQSERYAQMPQETEAQQTAAQNFYKWFVKPLAGIDKSRCSHA